MGTATISKASMWRLKVSNHMGALLYRFPTICKSCYKLCVITNHKNKKSYGKRRQNYLEKQHQQKQTVLEGSEL